MPIFGTTSPSCPPPPQFAQTAPFSPHSHTLLSIEATFIAAPLNAFCWRPRPENKETNKKNPKSAQNDPKNPPPPPKKPQNGGISPQNGAHLPCNAIQVPLPLWGQFASAAKKGHFCAQNAPKMGEMNPKRGWGGVLKGTPSLFCAPNTPKLREMNPKWGWGGFLKGPHPLFVLKMPQNWEK